MGRSVLHVCGSAVTIYNSGPGGTGEGCHGCGAYDRRMTRVFSGAAPSGNAHLGNLLGAFLQWAARQDEADCFYCVVDLHALTVPQDPAGLRSSTLELAMTYMACGIVPERSTVFVQSHVHEHAELSWLM